MSRGEYIEQDDSGPLCPQSIRFPGNKLHELAVNFANVAYDKVSKDADGEVDETDAVYNAVTELERDRMQLHRISTMIRPGGRGWEYSRGNPLSYIEAWYFVCPTCGFILPANMIRPERP